MEQFGRLDIGIEELRGRLRGAMEFEIQPHQSWLRPRFSRPEPSIQIDWKQVKRVLDRHFEGEITDRQLAEWATMLLLNDAYDWAGPDEDDIADALNELSFLPTGSEEESQ